MANKHIARIYDEIEQNPIIQSEILEAFILQNIKSVKKFPIKLLVIIPVLVALVLGFLLWKYGVNCPFMDEWDIPGWNLVQVNLNQLSLKGLIRQHNESRKFFPRLLFIYLSRSSWNPRLGMLISFLLSCLITFNVYYLSKLTLKETTLRKFAYLTLASMLIFSPIQWDNWLMGLQWIAFIPIAAITSALAIIFARNPLIVKLLLSAGLATLATFSFANGIISWIIIFPALYLVVSKNRRSQVLVTAGWLLLFSSNVAVYFHNYHRPPHHPNPTEALGLPIESIAYYLSFLGSPLGIHQLRLNQILGLIVCLLIACCCWYLLRIDRHPQLVQRLFPWLSILGYTLISGALTTVGRVSFGVDQSLASRYTTFSTYGFVGLIYIVAILVREVNDRPEKIGRKYYRLTKRMAIAVLALFLLLYPLNFARGVKAMEITHRERLYGKSCLSFINVVTDRECLEKYIYPNLADLRKRANDLDRVGLLQPSLILSDRLEDISRDGFTEINYGSFESLTLGQDNNYTASGWSALPQYNAPLMPWCWLTKPKISSIMLLHLLNQSPTEKIYGKQEKTIVILAGQQHFPRILFLLKLYLLVPGHLTAILLEPTK